LSLAVVVQLHHLFIPYSKKNMIKQTTEDKIKAQLVMVTGFLVLSFVFSKYQSYFIYASTGLGIIFVAFPFLGNLIVKLWFKLAEILGWINSRIILSFIFFAFLSPLAFFFRLATKNPLTLKKTTEKSVFTERNHKYTAADLENIW
jgi:hypothetical protein